MSNIAFDDALRLDESPMSPNKILCVLDKVEQLLAEPPEGKDALAVEVEPTPIAPDRARIVPRISIEDNPFHYADDEMWIILKPLLRKRSLDASDDNEQTDVSHTSPQTKKHRAHNETITQEMKTFTCAKTTSTGISALCVNRNRFRSYQSEKWLERFQELQSYHARHGNCFVPHNFPQNPALAQWVKRQRYQYKLLQSGSRSTLTKERRLALDKLGFIWDSHSAAWQERFTELESFLFEEGHCNVPSTSSKQRQLAVWVKCQRRQYKLICNGEKSNITQERILKLESIGFVWNPRRGPAIQKL